MHVGLKIKNLDSRCLRDVGTTLHCQLLEQRGIPVKAVHRERFLPHEPSSASTVRWMIMNRRK